MPETIRRKAARCRAHDRKPEVIIYDDGGVMIMCSYNCDKVVAVGAENALAGWNSRNAGFLYRYAWIFQAVGLALIFLFGAMLMWGGGKLN